jgi:hypothetical protein
MLSMFQVLINLAAAAADKALAARHSNASRVDQISA